MAGVSWAPEALDQLRHIVDYIRLFDPRAAERIAEKIIAVGESLVDFPDRGRPTDQGTRELPTIPPYILHYEVKDDGVSIIGVRHGARRPPE